jgi:L-fuculose-phosphate aldolase
MTAKLDDIRRYGILIDEFLSVGMALSEERLISYSSGNLSVIVHGPTPEENRILITRTGAPLGYLEGIDDAVIAGMEGEVEGASLELPVHRAIYKVRPDAHAIVHAHPITGIALSLSMDTISLADLEGTHILGDVPVVQSSDGIAAGMKGHRLVMLKGHGCFAVGQSLTEALAYVSTFEHSARILREKIILEAALGK